MNDIILNSYAPCPRPYTPQWCKDMGTDTEIGKYVGYYYLYEKRSKLRVPFEFSGTPYPYGFPSQKVLKYFYDDWILSHELGFKHLKEVLHPDFIDKAISRMEKALRGDK